MAGRLSYTFNVNQDELALLLELHKKGVNPSDNFRSEIPRLYAETMQPGANYMELGDKKPDVSTIDTSEKKGRI